MAGKEVSDALQTAADSAAAAAAAAVSAGAAVAPLAAALAASAFKTAARSGSPQSSIASSVAAAAADGAAAAGAAAHVVASAVAAAACNAVGEATTSPEHISAAVAAAAASAATGAGASIQAVLAAIAASATNAAVAAGAPPASVAAALVAAAADAAAEAGAPAAVVASAAASVSTPVRSGESHGSPSRPLAAKSVLRIAVGSRNPAKVEAARAGAAAAFPPSEIGVSALDAPSGVPDQPWGDAQTRQGALNRARGAMQAFIKQHGSTPEFAIGVEGGVVEFEAGACCEWLRKESVHCFAWVAVLRPGASPRWGLARTASFELPPPIVGFMRGSDGVPPMELGDADDAVFKETSNKQKGGTVGRVTHGEVDRIACYVHAMHLAFAPFRHEDSGIYD
eukprot:6177409-Pleurochrysis_carterae.AAC.1